MLLCPESPLVHICELVCCVRASRDVSASTALSRFVATNNNENNDDNDNDDNGASDDVDTHHAPLENEDDSDRNNDTLTRSSPWQYRVAQRAVDSLVSHSSIIILHL